MTRRRKKQFTEIDMISELNRKKGFTDAQSNDSAEVFTSFLGKDSADSVDVVDSIEEKASDLVSISPDELAVLVDQKATAMIGEKVDYYEDQVSELKKKAQDAVELAEQRASQLERDLLEATTEADRLKSVFKLSGNTAPYAASRTKDSGKPATHYRSLNYNTLVSPASSNPQGAARDFVALYDSDRTCPSITTHDRGTGEVYQQKDMSQIVGMLQSEGKEFRDQLHLDMEAWAKGLGFLQGNADAAVAGNTSSGSTPNSFLDYLSLDQRLTHSPQYTWWQFAKNEYELGVRGGTNILVERFLNLDEATTEADYLLDTDAVTQPISTSSQALVNATASITVRGYGLGKGDVVKNRPVAIPEFQMARSLSDLSRALNQRLTQNYNSFEDLMIRSLYATTQNVVYNNRGAVTTAPADVLAGGDGTLTEEFLRNLYARMVSENVLPYMDGNYVLWTTPIGVAQIANSISGFKRGESQDSLENVSNILMLNDMGIGITRPQGYVGTFGGFMVFQGSSKSLGVVGTEGVQNSAFGPGATLTRSSYAFGMGAVARGISLPYQIRMDSSGTFGTNNRFIWRSIEGYGAMDVYNPDPTVGSLANNGQQNRVWEVRTSDVVV